MKVNELKNILKEVVRETFREEIKDILLEAIKGGKSELIQAETKKSEKLKPTEPDLEKFRESVLSKQDGIFESYKNKNMTPSNGYNPGRIDTTAEGSALPPGEVSLDQIKAFIK